MALFVPNPERESVEEFIEELSVYLASRYRDAEDALIREVAARAIRDYQLSALLPDAPGGVGLTATERQVRNRILAELAAHRAVAARELQAIAMQIVGDLRADDFAQRLIALAAAEGEAAAAAALRFTGPVAPIVGTASQAVAMVALSLESRLEVMNQRLTRYPQDAYQRIIALYSPNTLLGVTTSRVQQASAVQRFLSEGITGFVDKSGRRWTIGAYAEMAGRTTVNRAFNDAGIWRMQQSGISLATVVRGLDSCQKCAAWAGAILSTDGSAPGPRSLPHATRDETVTIDVAGTVEQARAAGWGHPNCRCRLVAFSPGLTIPQGDTTYDEAAEKERARQRALEREIREAKRREASAMTDTERRRAAQDVRDAQAEMRDFIRNTGRNRQSYREQLGFADGGGRTSRAEPTPPQAPDAPRALSSSMKPHERTFYRRMESRGESLDWLPEDNITRRSTNDFVWTNRGGIEVELKSVNPQNPTARPNIKTIRSQVRSAVRESWANHQVVKENFILDFLDRPLDPKIATLLARMNDETEYRVRSLWTLSDGGKTLTEILLRTKK